MKKKLKNEKIEFELHKLTKEQIEKGRKYQCNECKEEFDEIFTDFKIIEKPHWHTVGGTFLCKNCMS